MEDLLEECIKHNLKVMFRTRLDEKSPLHWKIKMNNIHNEDNIWFRGGVSFPKHSRNTSLPSKRIQNLDDTLNKLQETGRKLEENNMKLDDTLNTLEENNRKLDDTLNTLEENNRKLEAIAERLEKRKMSKNTHLQKPPELL